VAAAFAAGQGLSFHLTSLDQNPFPSPVEDVLRSHPARGFVTAAVVVVVHEAGDGRLQLTRHFIRDLVHLVLDALMVPLQFPVGLRMLRRRQDVTGPYQVQVIAESPGYAARSILTQQSGPVLQGRFCHTSDINGWLEHLDQGISCHVQLQLQAGMDREQPSITVTMQQQL